MKSNYNDLITMILPIELVQCVLNCTDFQNQYNLSRSCKYYYDNICIIDLCNNTQNIRN